MSTTNNPSQKLPPQNVEAEKCLLGSIMIDPQAIYKVSDFLIEQDFYKEKHRQIYKAILELFDKREEIDMVSVSNRLKEKNQFENVGGNSYLTELVNSVPTATHILDYAKIVQQKRIGRSLIQVGQNINELGYDEQKDVDVALDEAERKIFQISQYSLNQSFTPVKDTLEETFKRIEKLSEQLEGIRGVPTGFKKLDNTLAGLQKSDLIILAARPSLGKSALATDIARYVGAREKLPVGIFSLEMSKDQVVDRLIAAEANVDLWRLRTGRLSQKDSSKDFERIQEAMGTLSEAPIYVDDISSSNILQMRAMARRLQASKGLGLLIVDYLQLMEHRDPSLSIVQQVTENSRALKSLAKELNIPVLILSQLSRAVEQRTPQIPRLADLRESGCLTGDTLITRADTGERIPIKKLVGQTNVPVHSLGKDWKIKESKISKVFSTGKKKVYRLKLRSGAEIKASANHPFWKVSGWTRLDELKVGDRIAVSKQQNISSSKNEFAGKERTDTNLNTWPKETWKFIINPIRKAQNISWREFSRGIDTAYCGSTLLKNGIGAERMQKISQLLNSPIVENMASSDVFWDEIVSIEPLGAQQVYDATVPGLHNFVANGIIVENSIEQDADVVLFIHREDKYKENTDRKNIADIIIAKHRNGPVGKAELYFDDPSVSFRDLQQGYEDMDMSSGGGEI